MNKLTKVGLSALCGSLVSVSAAHAGDLTVTGGADMTWISKGEDMTGNPIGIGSNFTLKGSGETEFLHYGIKFEPREGRTIIWPAEWTHAHKGLPVKETKYIITGWIGFR